MTSVTEGNAIASGRPRERNSKSWAKRRCGRAAAYFYEHLDKFMERRGGGKYDCDTSENVNTCTFRGHNEAPETREKYGCMPVCVLLVEQGGNRKDAYVRPKMKSFPT